LALIWGKISKNIKGGKGDIVGSVFLKRSKGGGRRGKGVPGVQQEYSAKAGGKWRCEILGVIASSKNLLGPLGK